MSRLWPRTLSGRIAIILVVGMIASQLITGTVWYDARYGSVAEVPVRSGGARVADIVTLYDALPVSSRAAWTRSLGEGGVEIAPIVAPGNAMARKHPHPADTLLADVLRARFGEGRFVTRPVELRDEHGEPIGPVSVFFARMPFARLDVDAQLRDGSWVNVRLVGGQEGRDLRPGLAAADYFLRIYLVRLLAVVLLSFLAVRLAIRPLETLSAAAERLGRNLNAAPLDPKGPQEVRRAAQVFNLMQQRLLDSLRERARFLAAVSHDLRSPITRLRLRAERIEPPELRDRFRDELAEMEAMIAATLDFVSGSNVEEDRRQVDIDTLVRAVAEDAIEAGGRVDVAGTTAAQIWGYPRSLRRGLQNLIENAVRYGGGHATVTMDDVTRDGTPGIAISIADEGPGIPEDALALVFEPFYRVEGSRNRATGGTGLGLAIARTIAQAHHGDLALRNRATGGLEAVLWLPFSGTGDVSAT
ncbi:MAG: Osmolarity sensor protein EnvZ [Luteibacter sp.]|uniref:ATP-binding protein n=1 Tax=Luteibacter sp. TaxID=1886636 RepID=UPI00137D80A5|nr:ATP-binding protein [Luteibacter sp.]KAF1004489.1 MAG: Osmolarity sensor protein EnvZ [Luteibacter sp.]